MHVKAVERHFASAQSIINSGSVVLRERAPSEGARETAANTEGNESRAPLQRVEGAVDDRVIDGSGLQYQDIFDVHRGRPYSQPLRDPSAADLQYQYNIERARSARNPSPLSGWQLERMRRSASEERRVRRAIELHERGFSPSPRRRRDPWRRGRNYREEDWRDRA